MVASSTFLKDSLVFATYQVVTKSISHSHIKKDHMIWDV